MEKQYESDEIEIDLKDLFFEVVAEWKKILVSTVLAAIIMYVVSAFILTPQYESTSKLYIMKSGGISSLTDLQLGTNLANDYMEVVDGRPILDQVIKNLKLDMNYAELKGMLKFVNPTSSRIIEITVTHPDAETAKAAKLPFVACTWGFCTREQLQTAQPQYMVSHPSEILGCLEVRGEK